MIADDRGVAFARDMYADRVEYGDAYWQKVMAYEDTDIARDVNAGRCEMLKRHLRNNAIVIDVGAGTGAFVRAARAAGFDARGYDVMPIAVDRLVAQGYYADPATYHDALCMWDTIEHLEDAADMLGCVREWLFVSVPVFHDLSAIRESRHYRPGEHLYYFTPAGLIDWLGCYGFQCMELSRHEMEAGRDSIGAFAFRRVRQ